MRGCRKRGEGICTPPNFVECKKKIHKVKYLKIPHTLEFVEYKKLD
jgi:hypothetical protein